MSNIAILHEEELRAAVDINLETVDCIETAFRTLGTGSVVMPPVLSMHLPDVNGEVDVKTAYIPGFSGFAVKVSPGFFDNPKHGLPSTSGLMIVFSATTGQVQAVLLDNGYLTDIRTAAAGAVAARALSRENSAHVAILGTGVQALLQLRALCLVRPIQTATICGRSHEKAEKLAQTVSNLLGIKATASSNFEASVPNADVIVTTTPATEPIIKAEWLRPGQHITAMGSDQSNKNELEAACLSRADIYVPDRLSQCQKMGELRAAIKAGVIKDDQEFAELGDLLVRDTPARANTNQITIADLTGMGIQDTAIATLALTALRKESVVT